MNESMNFRKNRPQTQEKRYIPNNLKILVEESRYFDN